MATATVSTLASKAAQNSERSPFRETKKRMRWLVGPDAAKTADDLRFTARNQYGGIDWWVVTPPNTDYWHVHEMLGRAYAFELLDYVHNPEGDATDRTIGSVCNDLCAWAAVPANRDAACGLKSGFFNVLSEFIRTGTAGR